MIRAFVCKFKVLTTVCFRGLVGLFFVIHRNLYICSHFSVALGESYFDILVYVGVLLESVLLLISLNFSILIYRISLYARCVF